MRGKNAQQRPRLEGMTKAEAYFLAESWYNVPLWAAEDGAMADDEEPPARPPAAVPLRRPSAAARALAAREPQPDAPPRGSDVAQGRFQKPEKLSPALQRVLGQLPGIPDPADLLDTSTNPVKMCCVHIFAWPHHCAAGVCCDTNRCRGG